MYNLGQPKKNEKNYTVTFKQSQVRELQQALMYHIDSVMIPFLEQVAREQDYVPTENLKKRIYCLQTVLMELNRVAGDYKED